MKWKAFYLDLCQVFKKHLTPPVEELPIEARLIKMIAACQKERSELGELVKLQGDSEVFKEFEQLRFGPVLAAHNHTGKQDDPMFR